MRLLLLLVLLLPSLAWAQTEAPGAPEPPDPDAQGDNTESTDEATAAPAPAPEHEGEPGTQPDEAPAPEPAVAGLPGSELVVAHVAAVPGMQAGQRLLPGAAVTVPAGGCLRLVAGDGAAIALRGPAGAELSPSAEHGVLQLRVTSGRGLLYADGRGAAIEIAGRRLAVTGGTAAFDADGTTATNIASEAATFDGTTLAVSVPAAATATLLARSFCAPPRPQLTITLGDPAELTETRTRARAAETDGGDGASAEGTATCVDSANTSTASDPNQGTDTGVDPDARRDRPGRVRVVVHLPAR